MKYVMFECRRPEITQRVPVIFPEFMVHALVAEVFKWVLARHHNFAEVKPVSAGFYDIDSGEVSGESETLRLRNNGKDDERTILTYSYTHGQV